MKAFLKSENLGFEDVEGVVGGEVAAANAFTPHLYPDEPLVGRQNFRKTQIGVALQDPGSS